MATSGANIKLGVTGLSQFKNSMNQAKQATKTLDAQLALTEKQFKQTGDAESYMAEKSELLKAKLEQQKKVVTNAEKALEEMRNKGVDTSSKAYQDLYRSMIQAKGAMIDTENELNGVSSAGSDAAKNVDAMNDNLKQIGKGVSFENVTDGLSKITDTLKNGAQAAVNLGRKIIDSAKGSTGFADEIKTIVDQYEDMGLTADRYQRMRNVEEFIDTPVDAILNAQQRMQRAVTGKNKGSLEEVLGISLDSTNADDLFWEIGEALMNMGEAFDKEDAATKLFGRSWRELRPLFKAGREEYEKALAEQTVLTDEQIEKLGKADDAIKSVEQQVELLKNQFWADNADKLTALLTWLVDNKDTVVSALTAMAAAFGALKLGEVALNVRKVVNGFRQLKDLGGAGGSAASSAANAASGAASGASGSAGGAAAASGGAGVAAKLGATLQTAAFVTPLALFVDGVIHDTQMIAEMNRKAAESMSDYESIVANHSGNELFGTWKTLTDYMTINGGTAAEDEAKAREFAEHYISWLNDEVQDSILDKLADTMTQEEWEAFNASMADLAAGTAHYSEEERNAFTEPISRALELIEQDMTSNGKTEEKTNETLDSLEKTAKALPGDLARMLNGVTVEIDGEHAGRLLAPYVNTEMANQMD